MLQTRYVSAVVAAAVLFTHPPLGTFCLRSGSKGEDISLELSADAQITRESSNVSNVSKERTDDDEQSLGQKPARCGEGDQAARERRVPRSSTSSGGLEADEARPRAPSALGTHFKVANRATVPINLLSLSSMYRVEAKCFNEMQPGDVVEVPAHIVWYDFYVTISKENTMALDVEQGWGLTKDTAILIVGFAAGAGVGGPLALGAGAAAATAVAAVVAWPVAIGIGIIAAGVVGLTTSMAASALTEGAFDLSRKLVEDLITEKCTVDVGQQVGPGMLAFTTVVAEDVQKTYMSVLRDEDRRNIRIDRIVMSVDTAEAYYAALAAKFSSTKLATAEERALEISGGFTLPARFGRGLFSVEFVPLHIKEAAPKAGCEVANMKDRYYWRNKHAACWEHCTQMLVGNPDGIQACAWECGMALKKAVEGEEQLFGNPSEKPPRGGLSHQVQDLVGKEVMVKKDVPFVLTATRAAKVDRGPNDEYRVLAASKHVDPAKTPVFVSEVHTHDFTAYVDITSVVQNSVLRPPMAIRTSVWFPLETLLQKDGKGEFTISTFTEKDRAKLDSVRYGECWSRRGTNDFFNKTAQIVGAGTWCYASSFEPERNIAIPQWCPPDGKCTFHFGEVCMPSLNRCGDVQTERGWYCVD